MPSQWSCAALPLTSTCSHTRAACLSQQTRPRSRLSAAPWSRHRGGRARHRGGRAGDRGGCGYANLHEETLPQGVAGAGNLPRVSRIGLGGVPRFRFGRETGGCSRAGSGSGRETGGCTRAGFRFGRETGGAAARDLDPVERPGRDAFRSLGTVARPVRRRRGGFSGQDRRPSGEPGGAMARKAPARRLGQGRRWRSRLPAHAAMPGRRAEASGHARAAWPSSVQPGGSRHRARSFAPLGNAPYG